MSVHVMSWVFRNSPAKLGDRLVLLILADKAEEDGTNARPAVATIATEACLSERQVQRCLRNLEATGQIVQTGRYRYPGQSYGCHVYSIVMKGDNMSPLNGSNGDISAVKGDIYDSSRVTPTSPNPSLEPPKEQLLAAAPRKRNEIWDALTHMFGEPATPSATKGRGKVCAELKAAGASPDDILSRGKNWPAHFDGATLTEHALVKHWHTLARKPLRRAR